MKLARFAVFTFGIVLAISAAAPLIMRAFADAKPKVELNFANAEAKGRKPQLSAKDLTPATN